MLVRNTNTKKNIEREIEIKSVTQESHRKESKGRKRERERRMGESQSIQGWRFIVEILFPLLCHVTVKKTRDEKYKKNFKKMKTRHK